MLNKIIVRQSMLFYAKAWRYRNEVLHDPLKHKSFVIEWHKKIIDLINRENRPEMKRHVRAQEINIDQCDNAYMRQWNLSTLQLRKISEEESVNDIRRYFVLK